MIDVIEGVKAIRVHVGGVPPRVQIAVDPQTRVVDYLGKDENGKEVILASNVHDASAIPEIAEQYGIKVKDLIIEKHGEPKPPRTEVAAADFGAGDRPDADAATVDLSKSVGDILEAVGDNAEAARAALEAEQAKTQPRVTLVEGLQAVIGGE